MKRLKEVLILGAGPIGLCYALILATMAKKVYIYELRSEKDCTEAHGRSVNLALGEKAWRMFKMLDCVSQIRDMIVAMSGRMLHDRFDDSASEQAYGRKGQNLDSINRSHLNKFLIDLAKQFGNVTFTFGVGCKEILPESEQICLTNGELLNLADYDLVIGADGVGSPTRESLKVHGKIKGERKFLNYGYVEIEFPAMNSDYSMPQNHLHIWPMGSCMVIALPNPGGTFTGGVFAPLTGEGSFAEIASVSPEKFFKDDFPAVFPVVPDFAKQYSKRKPTQLSEVRCDNWSYKNIVLVGDAAHGVTPFFGQGMNFGMLACLRFCEFLAAHPVDDAITLYQGLKSDADLLADWSLANFNDMASTDPQLHLRKAIEVALEEAFPHYNSHHSMVCFTDMLYGDIAKELERQNTAFEYILQMEGIQTDWEKGGHWRTISNNLAPSR